MKQLITATALSLCTISAFAQKGFYIKPVAGIGLSSASTDFYKSSLDPRSLLSYRFQVGLGYSFGNWSIESGIEYFRTGYVIKDLKQDDGYDPVTGQYLYKNYDLKRIYPHIGIPVLAGYRLPLSKQLTFEPALGAEVTYNLGLTAVRTGDVSDRNTASQDYFGNNHQRISLFGMGQLHLSYRLKQKLSLIGGFSGKYMLNNLVKKPDNAPPYDAKQRNYLVTFDLGVKYHL